MARNEISINMFYDSFQGQGLGIMRLEETIQSELARSEREHREREPKTVRLKRVFAGFGALWAL